MESNKKTIRALGLCSGGLDSILAALVLKKQGIDVTWVTFVTPFFGAEQSRKASKMTGVPLIEKDITEEYLVMLKNPPGGYGKNMNPCRDCHAMMFRLAGEMMESEGYDFLFSGEVAGQRPMSQNKNALRYVEKHSGFDGHIVRPLSAKILPETDAEKKGIVDREQLLDLSGRSRKPQMALAQEFGIKEYPSPAGGCILTEKVFSERLRDLFSHLGEYRKSDFNFLKTGRHFRLSPLAKIVVGRNKGDNEFLQRLFDGKKDFLLKAAGVPGPVVIVPGGCGDEDLEKAAVICLSYSRTPRGEEAEVTVSTPGGDKTLRSRGVEPASLKDMLI